jgi:hypothetical protein
MGTADQLYIGIDLGTSGCRAIAIDEKNTIQGQANVPLPEPERSNSQVEQQADIWWQAIQQLLTTLFQKIAATRVAAICVDGTSSTLLLVAKDGTPLTPALMYNDARSTAQAEAISNIAPRDSAAHGPSSGLAKAIWLKQHTDNSNVSHLAHQADWIIGRLSGQFGLSDTNNCLKLGYDPINKCWPDWISDLGIPTHWLPKVMTPGTTIGNIDPQIATQFGLGTHTRIVAGTTDSTAAFIATGASQVGEAVTSLGSTLVCKVISQQPIFAPEFGIYSQPLGHHWLIGGGSNSGGTVLRQFFTPQQITELTQQLMPEQPTGLDYYPLPGPGERFPVCDPGKQPNMTPRPEDDAVFFQGLLEGMAEIETMGYQRLAELGTPYPISIRTVGGGANNIQWTKIRKKLLGVPMLEAHNKEAAYGAALLARNAI